MDERGGLGGRRRRERFGRAVNARARIAVLWAVACLGGLAATAALTPSGTGKSSGPEEPGRRESIITAVPAVDCERIAEEIRQADAGSGGANPRPGLMVARSTAVPEECVDELQAQGLW
ncbi:hypothetical protein [Streptomyces yaizuensis]|uniref:Uncharacterized protein n=1 Tax=Streptomyces yaizuensis TaxID=2989713 RepID=A0ABQ5NY93_9ACTN|nr:hypothetical protein [Streptomyces sp. YSPA8]GLF95337.1 hypothetical protein SYYSPA8_13590 [Streptomyces sp. YSPA8]